MSDPDKRTSDEDLAQQTGLKHKPALSGFHHIEEVLVRANEYLHQRELFVAHKIKEVYFKIARANGLNKSLGYRIGLLMILALTPWISQASVTQEEYSELMKYSEPLDPIQAGNFERNLSQYSALEFYVDPEKIILAEMEKNEDMPLQQQLAINANKNIEVPERQAPTYELQNGETITQIAEKFNLHVGTILDANNLKPEDLKRIKPGTVLSIPSSDTNTSNSWLIAINEAEEKARQEALKQQQAQQAARQRTASRVTTGGVFSYTQRGGGGSSNVTVIGCSSQQCLPWARAQTGIQVRGYAGNVGATQSEPVVGGLALDRFYGHISVVVSVGADYIVVHEANYIPGRITERTVSKAAIRGYVY